jgi:hypothetical protein
VIHGLWRVSGRRAYRGHEPGSEPFEASLNESVAARAINRGDIELLEEFLPALPAEFCLPEGWIT